MPLLAFSSTDFLDGLTVGIFKGKRKAPGRQLRISRVDSNNSSAVRIVARFASNCFCAEI